VGAAARNFHSHSMQPQNNETPDQKGPATLLQVVRDSTERFKDVHAAEVAGYKLTFGCVTGPDAGAMGLHFVNFDLVGQVNNTGVLDPTHPQIVIYEPAPDGSMHLTGADFLVFQSAWDAKHPEGPPVMMGQLFHLFDFPNRFGLPAFYTLHVWAWKDNPNGAFVNWHPNVSCKSFVP
jgi:hypothetical protein